MRHHNETEGLNDSAVLVARTLHGYNEIPQASKRGAARLIGEVVREPMFLLLLSAAGIYLLIGSLDEGLLLACFALLSIGLTVFQEHRSERALQALRELATPTVRVIRAGAIRRIPARELVPGDWMFLDEGERVAADAIVRHGIGITVDESLLTGESVPVRKCSAETQPDRSRSYPGGDDSPLVYAGTLICSGHGQAEVLSVGVATEMGRIGKAIDQVDLAATPLQQSLRTLILRFALLALGVSLVLFLWYGLSRGDWLQGALSALALGMAMLPEEFPMAFTILLALAAWQLAQRKVLVRRPVVLQTLGGVTLLCVDKTGTLTENRMRLSTLVVGSNFRSIEFGTRETMHGEDQELDQLIEAAMLASRNDSLDPIDRAVITVAQTHRRTHPASTTKFQLVHEFPLSPELPAVARIWLCEDGFNRIVAKGAPEAILSLCHLDELTRKPWLKMVGELADSGLRVLAVAEGVSPVSDRISDTHEPLFYPLGLLAFEDPVRKSAAQTVAIAQAAGISVAMITGDYPSTAQAIARQIGIETQAGVLRGDTMDTMDDPAMAEAVARVRVYARIRPEQKLRLVQLLQRQGQIVAMTGDGVNDAPALKAAHVGIAMGEHGTDVAREAASLVLLDENLDRIVESVRRGRHLQDTLARVLRYVTAIHVPIAGLALIPVAAGLPPLLLPAHVVLTEMVVDPMCSVAFAAAPDNPRLMKTPPSQWQGLGVKRRDLIQGATQGLALLLVCLLVYVISLQRGADAETARTLSVIALTAGNLALVASHLTGPRMALNTLLHRQMRSYWVLSALAAGVLAICIAAPTLRTLFHLAVPSILEIVVSSGIAAAAVLTSALLTFRYSGIRD